MTKDELLKMLLESGYKDLPTVRLAYQGFDIQHFANLVAAAEREACALVCETLELPEWPNKVRQPLAQAIRARSES